MSEVPPKLRLPADVLPAPKDSHICERWRRYYKLAVPELVIPAQLRTLIVNADWPDMKGLERQLRTLEVRGLPRAETAWVIGQALRAKIPWSSGPISLWLAGHFADFTGFFATWWLAMKRNSREDVALFALRLVSMLQYLGSATVFDRLPHVQETYADMEAVLAPDDFGAFRFTMRPIVNENDEIQYKQRVRAQDRWVLSQSAVNSFDAYWRAWLNTRRLKKTQIRDAVDKKHDVAFRQAYRIARSSEFSREEVEDFVFASLLNFFGSARTLTGRK